MPEEDYFLVEGTLQSTFAPYVESGLYSDVEFLVGPDKVGIKAHQTILKMRSPVFASMLSDTWKPSVTPTDQDSLVEDKKKKDGEMPSISLPHMDPLVFKTFLLFIYSDQLPKETDDLLHILPLGDMYSIPSLFEGISKVLEKDLSLDNCINIYESTKFLNPVLSRKGLDFAIRNMSQLLQLNSYLDTGVDGEPWSFETWKEILETSDDDDHRVMLTVEEVELFLALVKWAEGDDKRGKDLQKYLLPLIRYPIMTTDEFTDKVIPTNLLPDEATIKLLLYYVDDKGKCDGSNLGFKLRSRNVKIPRNEFELEYFLKKARPGDLIRLRDYDYEGAFKLTSDYVRIEGSGPNSAITTADADAVALLVTGNRCQLTGISIRHETKSTSNEAIMPPVRLSKPLLEIKGSRCLVENCTVNTGTYKSEVSQFAPSDQTLLSPPLRIVKQNPCWSIALAGDGNRVQALACINRGNAVLVEGGSGNVVSVVTDRNDSDGRCDFATAVSIEGGSGHRVEGISGDWYLRVGGLGVEIQDCIVLGVNVDGWGHCFTGVVGRKWIKIKSGVEDPSGGHKFDDRCNAGRWEGLA